MLSKLQNKRGFTLIELLIVVVILGVLILIVIGATKGDKGKANDAKRKADLTRIQNSLEDCYKNPTTSPDGYSTDPYNDSCIQGKFDNNAVPTDPKDGAKYSYTPTGTPVTSYSLATTEMEREANMTLTNKQ